MSLALDKKLQEFCDKHDINEYGMFYMVTMPDGYSFITMSVELSNRMLREHGAQTRHIIELGE
jgi:predicted transcriptional regulator